MSKVSTAGDYFDKCTDEWAEADRECSRTYAVWQDAVERRVRLAIKKNDAWRELTKAREEAMERLQKQRGTH